MTWTWRGWDVILQTRTSGVASYVVQARIDSGSWSTIGYGHDRRPGGRSTNRAHGHYHGVRVAARDAAGNLGAWSSEMRIWVP